MDMYRLRNICCKIIFKFKMLCIVSINFKYKVFKIEDCLKDIL